MALSPSSIGTHELAVRATSGMVAVRFQLSSSPVAPPTVL